MIYNVFSIYDEKAEAFLPPFILPKVAQAKRIFADCINSDDHQFGQHPADYTLFRLGTFNDEDGQFLLERSKQPLGNGVEYVGFTDESTGQGGPLNGKNTRLSPVTDESPVLDGASGENSSE